MTNLQIAHRRLHNQLIAPRRFQEPGDVVRWLGAVQAQDYLGALWAAGLRLLSASEAVVEQALADRTMVRTWPMRGTLHFVAPEDVRWMLKLLTPRIVAANSRRLMRDFALDNAAFSRSEEVLVNALQGGRQLPRNAMYAVLEAGGISAARQRGLHILWRLAQEGMICFAAREGKQPTFALLDEWVPPAESKTLEGDEALAELASRYFTSHGPATVQDFAWWSGLQAAQARAGLEMVKSQLLEEVADGRSYWLSPSAPDVNNTSPTAYLLPAYDEYTVAYRDRGAVIDPARTEELGNGIFNPTIVIDSQVVGTWKRMLTNDSVAIAAQTFPRLSNAERDALMTAANRYGRFLGLPVVLA